MKTKNEIKWERAYSAIPGAIIIPAGSRVVEGGGQFWVSEEAFPLGSVERHDARTRGVWVDPENVDLEMPGKPESMEVE